MYSRYVYVYVLYGLYAARLSYYIVQGVTEKKSPSLNHNFLFYTDPTGPRCADLRRATGDAPRTLSACVLCA